MQDSVAGTAIIPVVQPITRVTTREGAEIFVRQDYLGPPWRAEQAGVIVLLHGICESSDVWYAWVAALAGHYRVVSIDLPGHGRSRLAPGLDYEWSPARLAGDVRQVLEHLQIGRLHLVGAKYGASIAVQYAAENSEQVASLSVVSGPVQVAHTAGSITVQESLAHVKSRGLRSWAAASMPSRLGPDAPADQCRWWIDLMASTDLHAACECLDAFSRLDLREQLSRIKAPTLFVTTRGNQLMELEPFKEWAASISGARLVVLDARGYHPAATRAEECIAAVLPHIEAHLDQRPD